MPRMDPRTQRKVPTQVNDMLADRAIRHALYLERYKTGLVNEIIEILNQSVEPKLLRQIEIELRKLAKRSPVLTELFRSNGKLVKAEYRAVRSRLDDRLNELSQHEAQWQIGVMKAAVPIEIEFVMPSPQILSSLVTQKPMEGALVKAWFDKLSDDTAFKVNQQIQIGMVHGEGIEQIVRRIAGTRAANYSDGILNISRRHIQTLVRTSVAHVASQARSGVYEANRNVIKGWQFRATLDDRTTMLCMSLDGRVFDIDDEANMPPLHMNCRSTHVPVLKSWKELGISLKEAPTGTRASMDGQVSESWTYSDWLKRQSTDFQNEVLGKERAKLFRRGTVPIERFVDRRNRPLTLDQLRKLENQLN